MVDASTAVASQEGTGDLRKGQILTVALLVVGYAGYYLCRSHLSVATPLIIKELGPQGVDKVYIGGIASLGTLFYAFGKFASGSIADFLGGRRMFLTGMAGAVFATLLFGLGGVPFFTLAWVLNRAIQSAGWVGMVKIASRWFSYSTYGAAMGIISLSYLFGDFLSRVFLGQLITMGLGWRGVFVTAACVLAAIFCVNLALLRESPKSDAGPGPEVNPSNLFGREGDDERPDGLAGLLIPLLSSGLFWTVCLLSLGFTLVRETFNTWTPEFLTEVAKMDAGAAAQASSLFPLFGGISVFLAGIASDRLGKSGRAIIILAGLLFAIPALLVFGFADFSGRALPAMIALGAVAFLMLGPYSFLAGAISLDFGGKRGSATACGWIDGIGYLGGVLAGKGIGSVAQHQGWPAAFLMLAGVAAASSVAAALYLWQQTRRTPDLSLRA